MFQNLSSVHNKVAILTPLNLQVNEINDFCLKLWPGEIYKRYSVDTVERRNWHTKKDIPLSDKEKAIKETLNLEDLTTKTPNGFPPAQLKLKVGAPLILLRNLNPSQGLVNGTRLKLLHIKKRCLIVERKDGEKTFKHFLCRISFESNEYGFPIKRFQFPVKLCFAMTVHKAQGQTLSRAGLYLPVPCFAHGSYYTALSRVSNFDKIKVFAPHWTKIKDTSFFKKISQPHTRNIVYDQVLTKPKNIDQESTFNNPYLPNIHSSHNHDKKNLEDDDFNPTPKFSFTSSDSSPSPKLPTPDHANNLNVSDNDFDFAINDFFLFNKSSAPSSIRSASKKRKLPVEEPESSSTYPESPKKKIRKLPNPNKGKQPSNSTIVDDMQFISDNPNNIEDPAWYFEKQQINKLFCLQHAINNLLQHAAVDQDQMIQITETLAAEQKVAPSNYGYRSTGYYNMTVGTRILKTKGIIAKSLKLGLKELCIWKNHKHFLGCLIWKDDHFVALHHVIKTNTTTGATLGDMYLFDSCLAHLPPHKFKSFSEFRNIYNSSDCLVYALWKTETCTVDLETLMENICYTFIESQRNISSKQLGLAILMSLNQKALYPSGKNFGTDLILRDHILYQTSRQTIIKRSNVSPIFFDSVLNTLKKNNGSTYRIRTKELNQWTGNSSKPQPKPNRKTTQLSNPQPKPKQGKKRKRPRKENPFP